MKSAKDIKQAAIGNDWKTVDQDFSRAPAGVPFARPAQAGQSSSTIDLRDNSRETGSPPNPFKS